jgi:hypothetical protein
MAFARPASSTPMDIGPAKPAPVSSMDSGASKSAVKSVKVFSMMIPS